MFERLLFKFVEYFPILVLSNLAVSWLYKKGREKLISLQQETLPNARQLIVKPLNPMMDKLYDREQYPMAESHFDPGQIAHLDYKIDGLVIGMDSDYPFRTIDLSGKGTTNKRLLDNI